MLTQYEIKLEKDGLIIKQRVEPATSQALPSFSADNSLKASFQQSMSANVAGPAAGGSSADSPFGGGGGGFTGTAAAPITIIGPNILMCCPCHHAGKESKE
jgi:hypothetical protein